MAVEFPRKGLWIIWLIWAIIQWLSVFEDDGSLFWAIVLTGITILAYKTDGEYY